MKKFFFILVLSVVVLSIVLAWSLRLNVDYVRSNAESTWNTNGYTISGYQGYSCGILGFGSYGGAAVWYTLRADPDNGITYQGALVRWGDEIHIYNLQAIDAIKP